MLSHKICGFWSSNFQIPATAVGTNLHNGPERLLRLPCASPCECVCELNMMKCFPVRGLLTAMLSQESLLSDTGRGSAVTPAMASWGTKASSHCVRGQNSQWSVKLITTGTSGYSFITSLHPHFRNNLDRWIKGLLSHFETNTMQNQLTSRLTASNSCLWWPNWPKSHLSASLCFSFSYCFLISLSLTFFHPCSRIAVYPAHFGFGSSFLKVLSLCSLRLLGKARWAIVLCALFVQCSALQFAILCLH